MDSGNRNADNIILYRLYVRIWNNKMGQDAKFPDITCFAQLFWSYLYFWRNFGTWNGNPISNCSDWNCWKFYISLNNLIFFTCFVFSFFIILFVSSWTFTSWRSSPSFSSLVPLLQLIFNGSSSKLQDFARKWRCL